jgi:beta-ribofuranosylaminobenzene 5'-phosphate synthase
MRLRVSAPSRLHFGLMQIDPTKPHCYGGLGLMINSPAFSLQAETADQFEVQFQCNVDPATAIEVETKIVHATNAAMQAMQLSSAPRLRFVVETYPRLHSGLGAGTQIACMTVTLIQAMLQFAKGEFHHSALEVWNSHEKPALLALSEHSRRGKRSHIGLNGFLNGGFIYDSGQTNVESVRDLQSIAFPLNWEIAIVTNDREKGLSGDDEQSSFLQNQRRESSIPDRMFEVIHRSIMPSVQTADFADFAPSIHEYNSLAGQLFSNGTQHRFASQQADLVRQSFADAGFVAYGQSSWGPTMWAIEDKSRMPSRVNNLQAALQERGLHHSHIQVTSASNRSAKIERVD